MFHDWSTPPHSFVPNFQIEVLNITLSPQSLYVSARTQQTVLFSESLTDTWIYLFSFLNVAAFAQWKLKSSAPFCRFFVTIFVKHAAVEQTRIHSGKNELNWSLLSLYAGLFDYLSTPLIATIQNSYLELFSYSYGNFGLEWFIWLHCYSVFFFFFFSEDWMNHFPFSESTVPWREFNEVKILFTINTDFFF